MSKGEHHAAKIHLDKGAQVRDADIHVLPEGANTRELTMRLQWEGTPPEGMPLFVEARSSDGTFIAPLRLAPGVFLIHMRPDLRYAIKGEGSCRPFGPSSTQTLIVDGANSDSEITLTLPMSACD